MYRLLLGLLSGLLLAGTAQALQLGHIELTGQPDQPSGVQIEVSQASVAALSSARVAFASDRAHTERGINPAQRPNGLAPSLERRDDQAFIVLAWPDGLSADSASFDFIIEMIWAEGRLSRHYAIERAEGSWHALAKADARFGPTSPGDTLYSIADTVRPPAVAINQMMLALLEQNPRQFNAPNVNALQRDVLLQIPSAEGLSFPDQVTADREVRRQAAVWAGQLPEAPAPTDAQAPALRLLPPEEQAEAPSEEPAKDPAETPLPQVAFDNAASFGASEFQALAEQLERVELANERLEAQNRQLQRSLDALQGDVGRLEALLKAPDPSPSEQLTAEQVAGWIRAEANAVMADPRLALERPWSRGVLAGVAVFTVLMLLVWRLGRRRPLSARAALPEPSHQAEAMPTVNATSGDPLERALALMDAGQLESAQSILDDALGEVPDSIELRLHLLNVLYGRGDRAGFESEAHVLRAQIDNPADARWQRVAEMGRQLCPGNALFAEAE